MVTSRDKRINGLRVTGGTRVKKELIGTARKKVDIEMGYDSKGQRVI